MNGHNIEGFGASMALDTRKSAASTLSTPFPQQNVTQLCWEHLWPLMAR